MIGENKSAKTKGHPSSLLGQVMGVLVFVLIRYTMYNYFRTIHEIMLCLKEALFQQMQRNHQE